MTDDDLQLPVYAQELALIALLSAIEARLPGTRAAVCADLTQQANDRLTEPLVAEALHGLVENLQSR